MKPAPLSRASARSRLTVPPSSAASIAPRATIVDVARSLGRLGVFTVAARLASLDDLLGGKGPYTVFAPTDRAFAKVPKAVLDALLMDPAGMAKLLCHHVVPGIVKAPGAGALVIALPVSGPELTITRDGDAIRVDAARVVRANIRASNGVIHAIDTVLSFE